VKFPDAMSILALSACSKEMLHNVLLDKSRSESLYKGSERRFNNSLSNSAD
jgi:hypothetical protein